MEWSNTRRSLQQKKSPNDNRVEPWIHCLDKAHPLCREYPSAPGGGIVRISKGVGAAQVLSKQQDKDSETAKFLNALGEFTLFVLRKTSCRVR